MFRNLQSMTPAAREKFKLLLLPFLYISLGFIAVYTGLNWLLLKQLQLFQLKDIIPDLILPVCLPWVPILIWYQPRMKMVRFGSRYKDSFALLLMVWAAIALPAIFAQSYMGAATGKLIKVEDVSRMDVRTPTRYYEVGHHFINKQKALVYGSTEVKGMSDEQLVYQFHIVVPMQKDTVDVPATGSRVWLGFNYSRTIDSKMAPAEKKKLWDQFVAETKYSFDTSNISQFVYLERVGQNATQEHYILSLNQGGVKDAAAVLVLQPVNQPFAERAGNSLLFFIISLGAGTFLVFFVLLFVTLDRREWMLYTSGLKIAGEQEPNEFLRFFIPREGYFGTPLAMDLNILVFALMALAGLGFSTFQVSDLLHWGANFRPATMSGEWWRLLSCTFLHGGITHLVSNMVGLVFVGVLVEPVLGRWRFTIVYLLAAIAGSVSSLWWHPATVSVGASGAVFGLYGVFVALLISRVFPNDIKKQFLRMTVVFILYNLAMGYRGNIDNAAHFGGLVTGVVAGIIMAPGIKRARQRQLDAERTVEFQAY